MGSKLSRHSGLQRFARLPRVRKEPRRPALWVADSVEERDPIYVAKVRMLPCIALTIYGHHCNGRVQAHHAGAHGMGIKAPDSTCVPLCAGGHDDLHCLRGPFREFSRQRVRDLEDLWVRQTRQRLNYTVR